MKKHCLIIILFTACTSNTGFSQQSPRSLPSNFAGIETGLDLFHLSFAYGAGYERILTTGHTGAVSIKGKFFVPHRNSNLRFNKGYKDDIIASQLQGMIGGYLFIDKKDKPAGAFLYGGTGFIYTSREEERDNKSFDWSGTSAGGELGIGGYSTLGKKTMLQIKLSLSIFISVNESFTSIFAEENTYFTPGFSVLVGF